MTSTDRTSADAPRVTTVHAATATIGESPTWVPAERAIYWTDIREPALHRFVPATGRSTTWPVSADLGAFALFDDGGALVACRDGLHRLDLDSGRLERLADPPYDPALFRFNDGVCDANGRFWIGVMFDPVDGSPPPQAGRLHSFTRDGGLRPEPDAAELHNGMAWSPDGRTFYLSHTNTGTIAAFDYDVDRGRLSNRRVFATVSDDDGVPDGAAVDEDGGYWCALHGAGKLRRYAADGSVDRDVALPVSQPTMCAFAGDDLSLVVVTTAREGLTDEQLRAQPLAGSLLGLTVGRRGAARPHVAR